MRTKPLSLQYLDARRRMLGMSHEALARKSGVPVRTVVRILSGRVNIGLAKLRSLAVVLGLEIKFEENASIESLQEREARRKAEQLVKIVQGTSGLEGQAVSDKEYGELVRQETRK